MPAREERNENFVDDAALADDDFAELLLERFVSRRHEPGGFEIGGGRGNGHAKNLPQSARVCSIPSGGPAIARIEFPADLLRRNRLRGRGNVRLRCAVWSRRDRRG